MSTYGTTPISRGKGFLYLLIITALFFVGIVNADVKESELLATEEASINVYRDYHSTGSGDFVDTYSGALKVLHTDLVIPGNGGLDIKVQRTYDYYYQNMRESFNTGLGHEKWRMHFGRLFGDSLEIGKSLCHTPYKKDISKRPRLELANGTVQQFARAQDGADYLYISKENWIAKCAGSNDGGLIVYSPDGTRYDMTVWESRNGISAWNVRKITDKNNNWLIFDYTNKLYTNTTNTFTPVYLKKISSSDGRSVFFHYEDAPKSYGLKHGSTPQLLKKYLQMDGIGIINTIISMIILININIHCLQK